MCSQRPSAPPGTSSSVLSGRLSTLCVPHDTRTRIGTHAGVRGEQRAIHPHAHALPLPSCPEGAPRPPSHAWSVGSSSSRRQRQSLGGQAQRLHPPRRRASGLEACDSGGSLQPTHAHRPTWRETLTSQTWRPYHATRALSFTASCSLPQGWVVMSDVCPHRLAPLSEGRLEAGGTRLACAYHGCGRDGALCRLCWSAVAAAAQAYGLAHSR